MRHEEPLHDGTCAACPAVGQADGSLAPRSSFASSRKRFEGLGETGYGLVPTDRVHAVIQELDIEQSAFRRASCLPFRAQRVVDAKRVPAATETDDRPILRPVFFIYEHAT